MILKQCLLVLAVFVVTATAHAGKQLADVELDAKTRTRVELHSIFDPIPPSGYAPIRVVGTNGSDKATEWGLSFDCSEYNFQSKNSCNSEFALEIGPHSTAARTLMVPVAARYGDMGSWGNNRPINITLNAGAFGQRQFQTYELRIEKFPSIAISKTLAMDNMRSLKDEMERRRKSASGYSGGNSIFGSEYLPEDLPEDWRGLSGFDVLMISHLEWLALKPGARLAAMQWMRLGGRLHVFTTASTNAAGLGIPQEVMDGDKGFSLGHGELKTWDGKHLNAKVTVDRYWSNFKSREFDLVEGYSSPSSYGGGEAEWGLLRALGRRSFAAWQVVVFLVIFGILVGPINLFVLAPPSRRHRLFVTTPLLSLGASVLMIVILLLQDGVGGIGRRFVVVNVEPEEAAVYVTQEQASRTGFLMTAGFEMKQAALVEPVALPKLPWVKLTSDGTSQGLAIHQNGPHYSGNIFQSRAEQGQLLHAVISARSRLELKPVATAQPEASPEMVSALGFTADEVFYADDAGKIWKSTAAAVTGQAVKFTASDLQALKVWWEVACSAAGRSTQQDLERQIKTPRNVFFATAKQAPEFTLDTLKSIRWDDDQVVIFGSVPKS